MKRIEKRKALVIGINNYDHNPLKACVNDANEMEKLLKAQQNGNPNFSTINSPNATKDIMENRIKHLLKGEADHALFFFSGHGHHDATGGYLLSKEYQRGNWGISMEWLVNAVNQSKIEEITIILDCCHAGSIGNLQVEGLEKEMAQLRKNVTMLAASQQNQLSVESRSNGVFTEILLQGLQGEAADLAGNVTAAGLYNMADTLLTPWEQRPVFKSFVTQMSPLRQCTPTTPRAAIRQLISHNLFCNPDREIQLYPNLVVNDAEHQPQKVAFFSLLLAFAQAGLIACPGGQSIYEAALQRRTCHLTAYGRYLHQMISEGNF
ncbi:MAG: caspase domain-containing protein [Salibacteraceae bacterium]